MAKARSLDVVLSIRRRAEEQAERALAEAAGRVQQAKAMLDQVLAELTQTAYGSGSAAGILLETAALHLRAQRLLVLRSLREQAQQALRESEQALSVQQAAYLQERQRRETVDTVLEQRRRQERFEQGKRDTKLGEDLFLGRFGQRCLEST